MNPLLGEVQIKLNTSFMVTPSGFAPKGEPLKKGFEWLKRLIFDTLRERYQRVAQTLRAKAANAQSRYGVLVDASGVSAALICHP
jgi:hypothetical protein